nr:hypothetical protein [Tanacetum cinerariifolium]
LFLPPKIDLSYSGLEEFQQPKFQSYGPKSCETESKNASKEIPNELKESTDAPLVKNKVLDNKDCTVESPVVANCNYHHTERVESRNNFIRVTYNNSTRKTHPYAHRNMAPRVVLMKTGLRPLNTTRPVNTAHLNTTVHYARPMTRLFLPPKIDLSYSGLEEFQQPKFQSYGPKSCETESKNASKEIPNELKESTDAPLVKNKVLDNKDCTVESPVVV